MKTKANPQPDYTPKHLGIRSRGPIDQVDRIPWHGSRVTVTLECEEFTSLCPVTGQPDFGAVTIRYEPNRYLVESKSLKLYLMRYRDQGVFNEVLVDQMAADLYRQLKPRWLEVCGCFNSRGGIAISVTARRPAPAKGEAAHAAE
jgi:7-cyano-7-deazaguanine reductase